MRYASRADENHAEIAQAYRDMHCGVVDLHRVGGGCPDILVHFAGYCCPVEIKVEEGRLNDLQKDFVRFWKGPKIRVIRSVDQAIAHVTEVRRRFETIPNLYGVNDYD